MADALDLAERTCAMRGCANPSRPGGPIIDGIATEWDFCHECQSAIDAEHEQMEREERREGRMGVLALIAIVALCAWCVGGALLAVALGSRDWDPLLQMVIVIAICGAPFAVGGAIHWLWRWANE